MNDMPAAPAQQHDTAQSTLYHLLIELTFSYLFYRLTFTAGQSAVQPVAAQPQPGEHEQHASSTCTAAQRRVKRQRCIACAFA
jgi:hypothetical protein